MGKRPPPPPRRRAGTVPGTVPASELPQNTATLRSRNRSKRSRNRARNGSGFGAGGRILRKRAATSPRRNHVARSEGKTLLAQGGKRCSLRGENAVRSEGRKTIAVASRVRYLQRATRRKAATFVAQRGEEPRRDENSGTAGGAGRGVTARACVCVCVCVRVCVCVCVFA